MEVVEKIVAGEPDGVLISPGMLKQAAHLFAFRGALAPVLRADWMVLDERMEDLGDWPKSWSPCGRAWGSVSLRSPACQLEEG